MGATQTRAAALELFDEFERAWNAYPWQQAEDLEPFFPKAVDALQNAFFEAQLQLTGPFAIIWPALVPAGLGSAFATGELLTDPNLRAIVMNTTEFNQPGQERAFAESKMLISWMRSADLEAKKAFDALESAKNDIINVQSSNALLLGPPASSGGA